MTTWIVNVDTLSDAEMSFFGWELFDKGDEFSVYWRHRYNELQVISNSSPRLLAVDDWNDAQILARNTTILTIP